ncbi:hypothetical protein LY13_003043 [Prauserella aidingensis]|uniref:hypothetical protein n=1 Tax=Prauserella aidingensis TaxID=387890 RepID=UPI0020A35B3E|nr:hypothetical protein [Prauserella aidingensis]MCP2254276.1 hypothetical protein [Prauserella aidingensis]
MGDPTDPPDPEGRPGGIREPDPTLGKPAKPLTPEPFVQQPREPRPPRSGPSHAAPSHAAPSHSVTSHSTSRTSDQRSPEPRASEPRQPRIRRQRVVLAEPSRSSTSLRARVELEQQTSWGELLIKDLVKVQLRTAVLLGLLVLVVLCALPAVFYAVPAAVELRLAGIPLPWLLLAVAPFPLMFGVGLWYNRLAERRERDFVNMIEN